MLRKQIFTLTTDGAGAATAGHSTSTVQTSVLGKLYAIKYLPGSIVTGATVTITCEGNGFSKALWTQANAGTSNLMEYPRDLDQAVADGADLTGTAGGDRVQPVVDGAFKIVIASGGDTKTGSVEIYYEV